MALSAKKASTASLVNFVNYARANGYRITEMPPFDAVNAGHSARSWHKDKDGKYGQAADINIGSVGVSNWEKQKLRRLIPVAQSYGLGVIHDVSGRGVGAARQHRGHLHVDVGSYSNLGNGSFRQPGGDRHTVRVQMALHQPWAKRDNLFGPFTKTDINVLRAASNYGGNKFPQGRKRAQRVVGVHQDNVWGVNSRAGHDRTMKNLQQVWKKDGYYTGEIDYVWGPLMDKAREAFYRNN